MSIQGIAAGPDQIADGDDPSLLAAVDEDGNLAAITRGLDDAGALQALRVDDATEIARRHLAVSMAILTVLLGAVDPTADPEDFINDHS